jgi:hypothetical protein
MPALFPYRTLLPRRQQETMDEEMSTLLLSLWKLVYAWQRLEEPPISPLRMSLLHVFISTWRPPGFGL